MGDFGRACSGIALARVGERLGAGTGYYFPAPRKDVWLLSVPAIPVFGDVLRYTISPLLSWFLLPKLLRTMFAPRGVPARFLREFPRPMMVRPLQLRAAAEETARSQGPKCAPSKPALVGRWGPS